MNIIKDIYYVLIVVLLCHLHELSVLYFAARIIILARYFLK